ncbi:DUF4148 domain-containing protein [Paraburkholderia solisilvae]|uniref:DUF4148 domain-containing protein n=1 Tax=Paraburkholderia solisilvae TaxID=624376 RepID=A0A6J5EXB1_9BURK|nr:DUF4148 domain-containing protein [Paraburkholderia solisilvae]CAB3771170.1 hypothetical protein LMG29739_05974 [Paraburkholderia solisilvae]
MYTYPAITIGTLLALAATGLVSTASAQGLSRTEVRQHLIDAENDGSRLVIETSYSDVGLIYSHQAKPTTEQADSIGGTSAGTSQTSKPRESRCDANIADCVGPVSSCNIYFGS